MRDFKHNDTFYQTKQLRLGIFKKRLKVKLQFNSLGAMGGGPQNKDIWGGSGKKMEIFNFHPSPPPLINNERSLKRELSLY